MSEVYFLSAWSPLFTPISDVIDRLNFFLNIKINGIHIVLLVYQAALLGGLALIA